ncbi:MAG: hypothetical protein M1834_005382 [Cirrosporium novae-zelandiae]|nr:MAG: hypothetical protein M1834_005382 [Cirrosporium novae-zelandiae]
MRPSLPRPQNLTPIAQWLRDLSQAPPYTTVRFHYPKARCRGSKYIGVARYHPDPIPADPALKILTKASHPLFYQCKERLENRDQQTLWWGAVSNTWAGPKAVIRKEAKRILRSAFLEALRREGWDEEGRRLGLGLGLGGGNGGWRRRRRDLDLGKESQSQSQSQSQKVGRPLRKGIDYIRGSLDLLIFPPSGRALLSCKREGKREEVIADCQTVIQGLVFQNLNPKAKGFPTGFNIRPRQPAVVMVRRL